MPPFSSLLNFGTSSERIKTPPSTTHILATSTYPAPTNFLPLHYARSFLDVKSSGNEEEKRKKVVIWIGCDGSSESHFRSALKRSGATVNKSNFIFIDALEEILDDSSNAGSSSNTSNSSDLQRLLSKIDEHLEIVSRSLDEDLVDSVMDKNQSGILVMIDDASALAWAISNLDEEEEEQEESKKVDPRVQVLRSKRKGAIQKDKIGTALAKWIDEHVRERCNANSAILLTHLTAEQTTIIPPAPHFQPSRGGSYGVGTGFDADDAGEENEEEELYDEVADPTLEEVDDDIPANGVKGEEDDTDGKTNGAAFIKENIDWRVDSLLRKLLLNADLWIEIRGLRSGKARDCHGEVCVHPLFRVCMARQEPLPHLPLPSDPLQSLRSKDRVSRPLAKLNSLSLSTSAMISAKPWLIDSPCLGREKAMLFKVEAVGEAQAWSRGGRGN